MPGPAPKPSHLRQRTNKKVSKATLPTAESAAGNEVPDLPARDGGWHPMVREWWDSVWRSPMASEYLDADMRGGLYLLADLHQARWDDRADARALVNVAKEIRLQEVRFGLSPVDRSRLQWEVEKGEQAKERTQTRRKTKKSPSGPAADPRSVLKAVS